MSVVAFQDKTHSQMKCLHCDMPVAWLMDNGDIVLMVRGVRERFTVAKRVEFNCPSCGEKIRLRPGLPTAP